MKIRFTYTTYELVTRELQDAQLIITVMKGNRTCEEIQEELRASDGIKILEDDESLIVEYKGYTDILVAKDFGKAMSLTLINNYLLAETMRVAGRVSILEDNMSEVFESTNNLDHRTQALEDFSLDIEESQDNQDDVIADILENI